MSAAAQQLRDRLTFREGQPIEVTLERDGNPTPMDARDGSTEARYFLQGHKIMWVPEAAHEAIQRAAAGENATFAITKHARKAWSVIHIEDEPRQHTAPPHAATQRAATPSAQQQPAARHDAQAPAAETSGQYYAAMCAAINVSIAAEKYSQEKGRPLSFTTSDIRAMATTLYIGQGGAR